MKTTLRMPRELEQRLALWAQRLGLSRQALVVQALRAKLPESPQRKRSAE
ncbi:hypothetical protein [Pulveribacter sp.]|nr:hypothetical protein [Pulveribacter sp.]